MYKGTWTSNLQTQMAINPFQHGGADQLLESWALENNLTANMLGIPDFVIQDGIENQNLLINAIINKTKGSIFTSLLRNSNPRGVINAIVLWETGFAQLHFYHAGRKGRQETSVDCRIGSFSREETFAIADLVQSFKLSDPHPKAHAQVAIRTQQGFKLLSAGQTGEPLIRENYSDAVLESFDHIVSEIGSPHSLCGGKLSILTGPPGTGKTYLLEGIMDAYPWANYIIFPPALISELTAPDMLQILLPEDEDSCKYTTPSGSDFSFEDHYKPLILIIEDADQCLVARAADNFQSISTLLNLTDGILGRCLDVRVIATSNVKTTEVDKALIRSGRICPASGVVHLPLLTPEQATKISQRLTKDPNHYICSPMTLADVYRKAHEVGHV
jgi:hypothetical protein